MIGHCKQGLGLLDLAQVLDNEFALKLGILNKADQSAALGKTATKSKPRP